MDFIRMVGDENDNTSSLIGRKSLGNFIHCMSMVDDLLLGTHVENYFFINNLAGADKSLHVLG